MHTHGLIWTQLRAQARKAQLRWCARRITQLGEHFLQPFTRLNTRPLPLRSQGHRGLIRHRSRLESRDQLHALEESQFTSPGKALDLSPMGQCIAEFFGIHLDPLAPHELQAVCSLEQRLPLGLGQRLAVKGGFDRKIQERVRSQTSPALLSDPNRDPGTRRPAALPPIRQSDNDPGGLAHGFLLEKSIGFGGRPGERLEDAMVFDQFTHEGALFGGLLDWRQQVEQRRLVTGARVLLQCTAERQVLDTRLTRNARSITRHEGERMRRVPFVLGQVEGDPPDHPPQRVTPLEPGAGALRMRVDLSADVLIQLHPESGQPIGIEILAAAHGRCGVGPVTKLGFGGRG